MDSQKGLSFDLNEPPCRDGDDGGATSQFQSRKSLTTLDVSEKRLPQNGRPHQNSMISFPNDNNEIETAKRLSMVGYDNQNAEREEGEWSDVDESGCTRGIYIQGLKNMTEFTGFLENNEFKNHCSSSIFDQECASSVNVDGANQDDRIRFDSVEGKDFNGAKSTNAQDTETNLKYDGKASNHADVVLDLKHKELKGKERAKNLGRISKHDQQKEAMLGKKRNRQTMFLNLEDVKQVGPIKNPTLKRQSNSVPINTRTVREPQTIPPSADRTREKPCSSSSGDKKVDISCNGGFLPVELCESDTGNIGGSNSGFTQKLQNLSSTSDTVVELHALPVPRQESWKPQCESSNLNALEALSSPSWGTVENKQGSKKFLAPKKQFSVSYQYQDTSVERLIREVTSEMFSPRPGLADLQQIPGSFESVEEYISVFEPLLFEECRAQFLSSWEEQKEGSCRDMHVMVRVKWIEERERGWHDVVFAPVNDCKWKFKEGDVAVLSSPKPGAGKSKRANYTILDNGKKVEIRGRIAGTVRRHHTSNDSREPPAAILHFFVGDSYNSNSEGDTQNILSMLQPKALWHLTVLGSLATTQREYIALHAFRRLNMQMQASILRPSPDHFPRYEDQPPAMPDRFTPNFVDHLRRTFNPPQLSAIQWAAMHTAAGTTSAKRQDPWPFTLVQGPPGTGKTHTVWGMLNVIHLVQYQHYYTALLQKLAPESCSPPPDPSPAGSIDHLLEEMDRSILRTLPALCPKPRILVCAPSNAATDELLARVLDRGFIDGEMKVYRPDVARVGVDSQTRAAQAVSVERRTEQLLSKTRDEVKGWLHQLRGRDLHLSQYIAGLQRDLLSAASAGRAEGSVGVDPEVLSSRDQVRDVLLQNLAAAVEERDKVLVDVSRLLILEGTFRRPGGPRHGLEGARANLEASFADEAEVVFTTVSSSGRRIFSRLTHGFDMVVVDEAAQAGELSALPPLSLGGARCVLVGDPQQLPATVISKAAGTLLYSRSLLERFQQAGCPTLLLSVQYRMHPQIRDFPSRHFYRGRLSDSRSVEALPDEIYHRDPLMKPFLFYDVTHGRESHRDGSTSCQNLHEARFCRRLYDLLRRTLRLAAEGGGEPGRVSVGIVTPYKLQLQCLEREFEGVIRSHDGKDLYINTVDAFQGQERDVVIMSCVRASGHGVGFVADVRRMNVALTRARRALWVAGNAAALLKSDDWAALIADAKARGCFLGMDSLPEELLGPTDRGRPHRDGDYRPRR